MQDQLFAYFIQQLLESIIDMTLVAESKGGAGVRPPLIFRANWGPKGRKNFFGVRPALFLGSGWPLPTSPPPLIWKSGSATGPGYQLDVYMCLYVDVISMMPCLFSVCVIQAHSRQRAWACCQHRNGVKWWQPNVSFSCRIFGKKMWKIGQMVRACIIYCRTVLLYMLQAECICYCCSDFLPVRWLRCYFYLYLF